MALKDSPKFFKLLARDGPDCQLCFLPLSGDVSLDHIVPRSLGGGNELENLRLTHRRCNTRRSNKPDGTWVLIDVVGGKGRERRMTLVLNSGKLPKHIRIQ